MNESSKDKSKQTTMGSYFTRQSKDKEKDKKEKMEEDKPTNFIDRVHKFLYFRFPQIVSSHILL